MVRDPWSIGGVLHGPCNDVRDPPSIPSIPSLTLRLDVFPDSDHSLFSTKVVRDGPRDPYDGTYIVLHKVLRVFRRLFLLRINKFHRISP